MKGALEKNIFGIIYWSHILFFCWFLVPTGYVHSWQECGQMTFFSPKIKPISQLCVINQDEI